MCCGVRVPECPPAADAWTASASAPDSAAARASAAEVTVWTTRLPAARSAETTEASGMPKVKLTTGTGSESSRATLSAQWSSSSTASAVAVSMPWIPASGAMARA